MGTFLKIRDKTNNQEIELAIQEYSIGTYVIIDNDPMKQLGVKCSEKELIEELKNNPEIEVIER